MTDRSLRPEIRNPVLQLAAVEGLLALPPEARNALAALLGEISDEAKRRAQKSWKQNKGPMAAYWKVVGVYANHTKRAIRTTT